MARILVIDDEEMIRYTVRTALEMDSHDVLEAENGLQAMDIVQKNNFDLIITDIIMPEKEGIQTIIDIRGKFPDVPIIAITGGDPKRRKLYSDSATVMGANSILFKPFSDEKLIGAVNDCLIATAGPVL
ncbi:MAG: response regulator [Rhodospirillales bacterium]|nr:response regulator [Rhodospirillales bacterium]